MRRSTRMSCTLLALGAAFGGAAQATGGPRTKEIGVAIDIIFASSFEDIQAIRTTADVLAIGEAGSGTFGVRLAFAPPGDVTVSVVSSDAGAASVSPPSLVFTPSNFPVFQTVTVGGVADPDVLNETVTIVLSTPGVDFKFVTANVTDDDFTLGVSKTGSGAGTLTSAPAGIDCGTDCTENYTTGTVVAVNAAASTFSIFSDWGGACAGTGLCSVTMNAPRAVSAYLIFTGSDPFNCGAPGRTCVSEQMCSSATCVCRPGFVIGPLGRCIDPQSNPAACGTPAVTCGSGTPSCLNGSCSATCGSLFNCANACVDQLRDPLNCGDCGNACAVNEVCIVGTCEIFAN